LVPRCAGLAAAVFGFARSAPQGPGLRSNP